MNIKQYKNQVKDCYVPQGTAVGLIEKYDIPPSFYTDDSQKLIHFNPNLRTVYVIETVNKMELCYFKMKNWMSRNQMKLNKTKEKS